MTEAVTLDENQTGIKHAVEWLSAYNFEGHVFNIIDRDRIDGAFGTLDAFSEGENGDPINDAVYQRNRAMEEAVNIKITEKQSGVPYEEAQKLIIAGDDSFDVFTDGLRNLATMIPSGYLVNLYDIDTLHLENAWWDQQMNRDLSVMGQLFFSTGDISMMDNYGTWCIMFNKSIANDFDLPNIYDLVKNGKWTLDKMYGFAKTTAKDLDGNGVMDDSDQWGFLSETFNQFALWASGDQKITTKDKNDLPVLFELTNRGTSLMDLVSQFQKDTSCTLSAERVKDGSTTNFTNEAFGNGKALFMLGGMWLITKYRGYNVDFGVIPTPKYDEAQERYCNTYSHINLAAIAVPASAQDLNRTGVILEGLAELSKYTLTPAYYDISLKGKYIRDEESADMLDIILASRSYDLGMFFDWGNLFSTIISLATSNGDFASQYASSVKRANRQIEMYIESLTELAEG